MTSSVPASETRIAFGASSMMLRIRSAKMTGLPLPLTTEPSGSVVLRKLAAHSIR